MAEQARIWRWITGAGPCQPAPIVNEDGSYTANPQGRLMRVYKQIDTPLTFADMVVNIRAFERG